MKLLKKISATHILGNVVTVVREMEVGQTVQAYGVAGICKSYEQGISSLGEWTRFVGDFEAVNYVTGEAIQAPRAHVPDVLLCVLLSGIGDSGVINIDKSEKNIKLYDLPSEIEFSYRVSIKRLPNDPQDDSISWEYVTEPLVEIAPSEKLQHLTKLLALPEAPAKEGIEFSKKEPLKEPKPKK